jgi:hypothetical protein
MFSENLDDGEWNQIVIDNADGYIKVIVDEDNEPSRNSYKKLSLQTYQQNPFSGSFILIYHYCFFFSFWLIDSLCQYFSIVQ